MLSRRKKEPGNLVQKQGNHQLLIEEFTIFFSQIGTNRLFFWFFSSFFFFGHTALEFHFCVGEKNQELKDGDDRVWNIWEGNLDYKVYLGMGLVDWD